MNLKPIEMQVALPRTVEAGAQQHQQYLKPAADQTLAMSDAGRQAELSRKRAERNEETEHAEIRDDQRSGNQRRQGAAKRESRKTPSAAGKHAAGHPYKGHRIDLSL
jgi:hypothetical protein